MVDVTEVGEEDLARDDGSSVRNTGECEDDAAAGLTTQKPHALIAALGTAIEYRARL